MHTIERMIKLEQALRALVEAVEQYVPLAPEWPELTDAQQLLNTED